MSSAAESIQVRLAPGESADLDAVMEVMTAAFDERFGEGWTRSQCAGILPLSGVMLMLAQDEAGSVCGFSLLRTVADEAELLLLAVSPSAQRRGVGGSLLDHFIEHGRRSGIHRLHLEVRDGNPAVAMYQAFGFKAEGRRRKYYNGIDGSQHDALTMARQIWFRFPPANSRALLPSLQSRRSSRLAVATEPGRRDFSKLGENK